jgi:hypothetical protein
MLGLRATEILSEAGFKQTDIDDLVASGVVSTAKPGPK